MIQIFILFVHSSLMLDFETDYTTQRHAKPHSSPLFGGECRSLAICWLFSTPFHVEYSVLCQTDGNKEEAKNSYAVL